MLTINLTDFPELTTERMVLRELRFSDAEQVFALRSDPRVMEHVSRPMAKTIADADALIELIISTIAANDALQWAITLKNDDALIGMIGFWRIVKDHHLAELGYLLAHAHWGQGLITEAIAAVVPYGLGTLGLHRVEAITRPENVGSIRALEKNGFRREAHLRENVHWNGVFHDSLHFARLAEE